MREEEKGDEPKIISIRLTNGSLHLKARLYAMMHGLTLGKLVSIALKEFLARNAPVAQAPHTPPTVKTHRAGHTKRRDDRPRTRRSR
jgi:hypothetical protein